MQTFINCTQDVLRKTDLVMIFLGMDLWIEVKLEVKCKAYTVSKQGWKVFLFIIINSAFSATIMYTQYSAVLFKA